MFLVSPPLRRILKDASGWSRHSHPHAAFARSSGERGTCLPEGQVRMWRKRRRRRIRKRGWLAKAQPCGEGWRSHGRRGRCLGEAMESQSLKQSDAGMGTDCESLTSETLRHRFQFPFFWKTSHSTSVANSVVWLLHLASI